MVLVGCGFVGSAFAGDGVGGDGKCDCYFPNSNECGVYHTDGDCMKKDCRVKIEA